ncbi:MAG TPA: hypothetical protein VGM96_21675 [Reyranella sp.]|jgi:hypothetical protein
MNRAGCNVILLRRPWLTLTCVALLLLAPSLIWGTLYSHSSGLNLNWADQFARQVQAGAPYPRWLADSFLGLGSPTFYFYPPLPFWIDALVSVATLDAMSVSYRFAVTAVFVLWLSGVAMHRWLLAETGRPGPALIGAVLYMAAPYHLLDHYIRGAYAEFAAFAALPVALLGLRRIADGRVGGVPVLAAGYAALLLSHLPVALLASVTVLPAYALWRVRQPAAVFGGLLGLALAAVYLVPALSLQHWISAAWLWSSFYRIEPWFFFTPSLWPEVATMQLIVQAAVAYALFAVAIVLQARGLSFWPVLCLVCLALVSGLVPWFWRLPELSKVQFPWRLMTVVEFALVTALCSTDFSQRLRPAFALMVVAVLSLSLAVFLGGRYTAEAIEAAQPYMPLPRLEPKEYLPNGLPNDDLGRVLHGNEKILREASSAPLIACMPEPRLCKATEGPFGTLTIDIDADRATHVVLRRFFFPAWRLEGGPPLAPSTPLRLVSFEVPGGRSTARLERVALPEEQWGWAISGAALIVWLVLLARSTKGGIDLRGAIRPLR